jgi:molybdate transport system regulatory protein
MAIEGPLKLNFQIIGDAGPLIGPGKALVMEAIARSGSISAAGRELGMSYRRIWMLAESLNSGWREPVFLTRVGGGIKGGAELTPFGVELLETYRRVEARMMSSAHGADFDWLVAARSTGA